jgi:hypothetical protein
MSSRPGIHRKTATQSLQTKNKGGRPFGSKSGSGKNNFKKDLLYVYKKWGGKQKMLEEIRDDKDLRKTFLKTLLQLHIKDMELELKRKGVTPDGQGKNFIFFMDGLQKGDKVGLSDAAKLLNQMTDADGTQKPEEEIEEDETEDEEIDVGTD